MADFCVCAAGAAKFVSATTTKPGDAVLNRRPVETHLVTCQIFLNPPLCPVYVCTQHTEEWLFAHAHHILLGLLCILRLCLCLYTAPHIGVAYILHSFNIVFLNFHLDADISWNNTCMDDKTIITRKGKKQQQHDCSRCLDISLVIL